MKKIKVVWLCHLMNAEIDRHVPYCISPINKLSVIVLKGLSLICFGHLKRRVLNLTKMLSPHRMRDMAQWNTNGLREFEKFEDIDLFVVAPLHFVYKTGLSYDERGIHYRFFLNEEDNIFVIVWKTIKQKLFNKGLNYSINRKRIAALLDVIQPDIVHVIGAECPEFSLATTDINPDVPVIAQLQSLQRYSFRKTGQKRRIPLMNAETLVLQRADYFGTTVVDYITIIRSEINTAAKHLNLSLALTEEVRDGMGNSAKKFDFVYFANSIEKAVDLAIEAFALCKEKHPNVTLDVVGGFSQGFKAQLDLRIKELHLEDSIIFEGLFPTHEDVLTQIAYSRFALLPLKSDIISGTIREAMASGIPVLTTITAGTPSLNKDGQCALLSPIGDHRALADNMCLLLEDISLEKTLTENAFVLASKRRTNCEIMNEWRTAYYSCLEDNSLKC